MTVREARDILARMDPEADAWLAFRADGRPWITRPTDHPSCRELRRRLAAADQDSTLVLTTRTRYRTPQRVDDVGTVR